MKLNLENHNITSIAAVSSRSDKKVKSKIDKLDSVHKAFYNTDDKLFYVRIDDIYYKLKLVNYNLRFLFSTPDNDVHKEWTPKKVFKKKSFEDDITIYWRPFYEGMPIKGFIHQDSFIIDLIHYNKVCDRYYETYSNKL